MCIFKLVYKHLYKVFTIYDLFMLKIMLHIEYQPVKVYQLNHTYIYYIYCHNNKVNRGSI